MTSTTAARLKSFVPAGVFLGLAAAITLPWFVRPGFLFLLDFVGTPRLPPIREMLESALVTSVPHAALFQAFAAVMPTDLVQKIALALPFFLSGLSAFHLARFLARDVREPLRTTLSYSSGIWYAVNAFVITRVFLGHLYLLHAYALTPWALLAFLACLERPTVRRGLTAGLVAAATMLANAHHLVFIPLLLLTYGIAVRRPSTTLGTGQPVNEVSGSRLFSMGSRAPHVVLRRHVRVPRAVCAAVTLPIVLLAFASTAVFAWRAGDLSTPDPRGPWARALQAPYTSNLLLDALFLTGTAKDDLPFLFPYEALAGFGAVSALLLAVMALGAARFWRDQANGWIVRATAVVAGISVFLTIGVAHPFTEPVAGTLYRTFPPWLLLRDSAKFTALLALTETILLTYGVRALTTSALLSARTRLGAAGRAALPLVLAGLTLYLASPAFGGFQGQILPSAYPDSWTQWNERLGREQDRSPSARPSSPFDPELKIEGRLRPADRASGNKARMLFLPWHGYLPFSFTDHRTVTNPAPHFFTNAEVIAGDNSEVGGTHGRPFIYSESRRPLSRRIEALLREAPTREDFGSRVTAEGIRYVALATDSIDSASYVFLTAQTDLQRVFESPELDVWEVGPLHP